MSRFDSIPVGVRIHEFLSPAIASPTLLRRHEKLVPEFSEKRRRGRGETHQTINNNNCSRVARVCYAVALYSPAMITAGFHSSAKHRVQE